MPRSSRQPTTMKERDRLKKEYDPVGRKQKKKKQLHALCTPSLEPPPKLFSQAFFPTPTKKMTLLNVFYLLVLVPGPTAAVVAPRCVAP